MADWRSVVVRLALASVAAVGFAAPLLASACDGPNCVASGTLDPAAGASGAAPGKTRGGQAPAPSEEAAWAALDEAKRLRDAGKKEEAAARLEALARECSGEPLCAAIALLGRADQIHGTQPAAVAMPPFEEARQAFEKLGHAKGEGRALNSLGGIYADLGDERRALELYQQALVARRAAGDRRGEGRTLYNVGRMTSSLGDKRGAIEIYAQALETLRATGDRPIEAMALHNLGDTWSDLGDSRQALEVLESALRVEREVGDRETEALTLGVMAWELSRTGEKRKAFEAYETLAALWRARGEKKDEAWALGKAAYLLHAMGEKRRSIDCLEQALALRRSLGDRKNEADILGDIGEFWRELGEHAKALQYLDESIAIAGAVAARQIEAWSLGRKANVWWDLGDWERSLGLNREALAASRAVPDRRGEAVAHRNIALSLGKLDRLSDARDSFNAALAIQRELGARKDVADLLVEMAGNQIAIGETVGVREMLDEALAIRRDLGDRRGEGEASQLMGDLLWVSDLTREAARQYEVVLAVQRDLGDAKGEAKTLGRLSQLWSGLGMAERGLAYAEASLSLARKAGYRFAEAAALEAEGEALRSVGSGARALEVLAQARDLYRAERHAGGEAGVLFLMGRTWSGLGEPERALEHYGMALAAYEAQGAWTCQAGVFNNMAAVLLTRSEPGDVERAAGYLREALPRRVGPRSREDQAYTLANLARAVRGKALPQAILHAKQAVNLFQSVRGDVRGLGQDAAQSYSRSISWAYRLLADLLVEDGQVLEAQRVMDLLKEDELNRLLRRSAPVGGSVRLSPAEKEAEESYRKLAEALAEAETRLATLRAVKEPPPEVKAELAALEKTAETRREALKAYFAGLAAGLARAEGERERDAREMGAIQEALAELGEGSVAVYTIFGQEKVRLLVYGPETKRAREAAFDAKEVAKRVFALRQALMDPGVDAREASAKLYEVLVAPIAADLEEAKAKTILWSLDGPLRYVPTAALWDAGRKEWLAERYRSVQVTPASLRKLTQERAKSWKALGLGVTAKHGALSELKAVDGELKAVVKDGASPRGALPGRRLLDGKFTRDTLFEELKSGWPVVHIASHYVFGAPEGAEDEGSYLLLGDGKKLSLKELSELERPVFRGVDLLALSACETGVGAEAGELSGAEVDGLAMVAQQRGAAGVLATLWPVNDPATAAFMGEFYGRLRGGDATKAEALRQAQLGMLKGTLKAEKGGGTRALRKPKGEGAESEGKWSHPYYWAPFILLGNGR